MNWVHNIDYCRGDLDDHSFYIINDISIYPNKYRLTFFNQNKSYSIDANLKEYTYALYAFDSVKDAKKAAEKHAKLLILK